MVNSAKRDRSNQSGQSLAPHPAHHTSLRSTVPLIAHISQPPSTRSTIEATKAELHAATFRLVGGTLLVLIVGIATLLWLRHARLSLNNSTPAATTGRKKSARNTKKQRRTSAWEESGKRLDQRRPPPFEPGADDDTVDLDPSDLGPEDIDPKKGG